MKRSNRRKTLERPGGLTGLLRRLRSGKGNRRVAPAKPPRAVAPTSTPVESAPLPRPARPPRPPRDWRAAGRRALAVGLTGLKVLGVVVLVGGLGTGGFFGYRKVMASTYFRVKELRLEGTSRAPTAELLRLVEGARGQSIFRVSLNELARTLVSHPWIREARVERQLPSTLKVRLVEEEPRALLALGHLYLVNAEGQVFKQATTEEADGLVAITGISRLTYLNEPATAQARMRTALSALAQYQTGPRPPLSEVRVSATGEVSFFLKERGAALRFGTHFSDERLRRLDAVLAALGPDVRRMQSLYLDNDVRPDRAVVRMASQE